MALIRRATFPRSLRVLDPEDTLNQGLMGYWPLSGDTINTSAAMALDISGHGVHGPISGLTLAQGPFGETAIQTAGSSSSWMSTLSLPPGSQEHSTYTFWFRLPNLTAGGWAMAISFPTGGINYFTVNSSLVGIGVEGSTGGFAYSWTADLGWHHLAAVIDDNQYAMSKLYLDGIMVGEGNFGGPKPNDFTCLTIGGGRYFNNNVNTPMAIIAADARIYYRLLSDQEVARLAARNRKSDFGFWTPARTWFLGSSVLPSVSATGIANLGPFTAIGGAAQTIPVSATAAYGPFTIIGIAAQSLAATGMAAISPFAAGGVLSQTNTSLGLAALEPFATAGGLSQTDASIGVSALGPFAGNGSLTQGNAGLGVATLSRFTAIGGAAQTIPAIGTADFSSFTAVGDISQIVWVGATATLGGFTAAGTIVKEATASGLSSLGAFTATGTAIREYAGIGAILLGPFATAGMLAQTDIASATISFDPGSFTTRGIVTQTISIEGKASLQPFKALAYANPVAPPAVIPYPGTRNAYVARRVLARMKSRGEPMLLRRISMLPGSEPFKSPPDISTDPRVSRVTVIEGQIYLTITASTAIGRLVPGDTIANSLFNPAITPCTVMPMPAVVMTNADGMPQLDEAGAPVIDVPPPVVYNTDALAWNNQFAVVPVSFAGDPLLLAGPVKLTFVADQMVYGSPLSYEKMVAMGWVEVGTIGVSIAAHYVDPPPQVNDEIIFSASGGEKRSILQAGMRFSNGVNFLYPLQLR